MTNPKLNFQLTYLDTDDASHIQLIYRPNKLELIDHMNDLRARGNNRAFSHTVLASSHPRSLSYAGASADEP